MKVDLIAVSQTIFLIGDSVGTPIASVMLQNVGLTGVYSVFSIAVNYILWQIWREHTESTVKNV